MEYTDEQLIGRILGGEEDAFQLLVDKYKAKVYYIAYQMTGNHTDADDIAQETFIRVYKNLRAFKSHSQFYTWLYRILINCCMDTLRKRKRRGEYELNDALDMEHYAEASVPASRGPNPEKEAELNELRREVTQALDSLPPKHRMVFVLREFDGMPHHEIAGVVRCSEGTVRSRLHYARLKLQQKLRRFVE